MMKLTKHQKQIVDKIVEGKVYDITSYLRGFEKVHEQKYDIQEIEKTFNSAEEDKKYSFSEKESYFYTQVYDACGKNIGIYKVADTLTYKFKDYPLVKPVKAKLTNSIDRVIVPYKDQKYTFDFCNNVLVADSFNDIKEFIALWCYLKSQALIFDVHKPVIEEDLGLFFELKSQKIRKEPNPTWKVNTVIESKGETVNETESHSELVPYKNINDYIEKKWEINDENLKACEEFLDKKIISTGALKVYKQKKYKTVEEVSVKANLRIAVIAVVISVISVIIGNLLPLFQKQETEYLDEISNKISALEEMFKEDNRSSKIIDEITELQNELTIIEEKMPERVDKLSEKEKGQSREKMAPR